MAARSLPVLTHPTFPQVLDALMGREVQRVEKILGLCCWESPESRYGACDGGFPCHEPAVVTHLEHQVPYCLSHFREAE